MTINQQRRATEPLFQAHAANNRRKRPMSIQKAIQRIAKKHRTPHVIRNIAAYIHSIEQAKQP